MRIVQTTTTQKMINSIEISLVYSNNALKIKKFLDSLPKGTDCINYMDIYNKLTKNDYLQSEPSDAVVSSYLMINLQSALNKRGIHTLYYVLSNSDASTIESIQKYIKTLTTKQTQFKLYYTPEIDITEINSFFYETIKFEINSI